MPAQPGSPPSELSPGEALAEAWLRQRGFAYKHEEWVGERRPDFMTDQGFAIECYEPHLRLPTQAGSISTQDAIRGAFQGRKKKQASEARKAGTALLVALAETNSTIPFDSNMVAAAMLGDLSVTLRLDGEPEEAEYGFGSNRQVLADKNRGVSGLALMRWFNPTAYHVRDAIAEVRARNPEPKNHRELQPWWKAMAEAERAVRDSPRFQPGARRVAVKVFHNPFAQHPLDPELFGVWDEQSWEVAPGKYGLAAQGRLRPEVHHLPDDPW